jgi:16S rRNA (guanine966-N2)-methyltransferase
VGKGDAGAHLRPTSDRVRESLFSILMSHGVIEGARALDLFAGTGALGLEALSRGAASVTFVENGRVAQKLLRENIGICRAEASTRVVARDARRLGAGEAHDLIFLDPPYGKSLGEAALDAALAGGWMAPGALVVWEESADVVASERLTPLDERQYGDTMIRLFTVD